MIKVTSSDRRGEMEFTMQGHAGYGNPDIVCAGASAIYFALAGTLGNICDDLQKIQESGNIRLAFRGGLREKTCLQMATIGLLQLQSKYPDNICVEEINIF